jgi:microcystin-dependent protein
MSEPFLAQISIVSFNFPPKGWALCNGQLLPINQNQALFSLLGTTFGGNGVTNFALPNLRGRAPVHFGSEISLGEAGGLENVSLTLAQLPPHSHLFGSGNQATASSPNGNTVASRPRRGTYLYTAGGAPVFLNGSVVEGGGQAHANMQPSLTLNFVIALTGIFPSRN